MVEKEEKKNCSLNPQLPKRRISAYYFITEFKEKRMNHKRKPEQGEIFFPDWVANSNMNPEEQK